MLDWRDRELAGEPSRMIRRSSAPGHAGKRECLVAKKIKGIDSAEDCREIRPILFTIYDSGFAAGREPSNAAVVRGHAGEDRDAAVASGIVGLKSAADLGDEIGEEKG